MPFEPKIIRADDDPVDATGDQGPHGEILTDDLPADLEALAQQLSDDAAFLTAKYPAGLAEKVAEAAVAEQRRRGGTWRAMTAAAVLLVAAGTGWLAYNGAVDEPVAETNHPAAELINPIPSPKMAAVQPVVPVVNSQDFMDLDPADREAVVDLMLEGQLRQPDDISL